MPSTEWRWKFRDWAYTTRPTRLDNLVSIQKSPQHSRDLNATLSSYCLKKGVQSNRETEPKKQKTKKTEKNKTKQTKPGQNRRPIIKRAKPLGSDMSMKSYIKISVHLMGKENAICLSIILKSEGIVEKLFTVIKLYLDSNTLWGHKAAYCLCENVT